MKPKPWITLGLGLQSISAKNNLLTNFINKKDPILKEKFHTNYKKYRKLLSTLMKKSKWAYYDKYFEKKNRIRLEHRERDQIPYFSKTCSIQCTYHTLPQ